MLYRAAFKYQEKQLWKKLTESNIFSIRQSDGKITFISITGSNEDHCSMDVYNGEEAFRSFLTLAGTSFPTGSNFRDHELLIQLDYLQLILDNKENLPQDEIKRIRQYAGTNNILLSDNNSLFRFIKFQPNHAPWPVTNSDDIRILTEAAEACALLADELKTKSKEELGIKEINSGCVKVPLFEVQNGILKQSGDVTIPEEKPVEYHYLKAVNEVSISKVRKLKRKGIWEAELVRMMRTVSTRPDAAPYYPFMFLVVNKETGYQLPVTIIEESRNEEQEILQAYVNAWKDVNIYPEEIRCSDERTFAMLKDFSEKTNVKITIYEGPMKALEDAKADLLAQNIGIDSGNALKNIERLLDYMLMMDKEQLQMMPPDLLQQFRNLLDADVLPAKIKRKLQRLLSTSFQFDML